MKIFCIVWVDKKWGGENISIVVAKCKRSAENILSSDKSTEYLGVGHIHSVKEIRANKESVTITLSYLKIS